MMAAENAVRGRVHNTSIAGLAHMRPCRTAHPNGSHKVNVDLCLNVFRREGLELRKVRDAGVVYDRVETAPGVDRGPHHGESRGFVGNTMSVGDSCPASVSNLLSYSVRVSAQRTSAIRSYTKVVYDHLGAA